VQSGKLWVSYDSGTAGESTIGDFDLSTASPVLETQAAMGGWYSAPMIAADPSDTGNVLVAIQPGISPASAASYNTSQDPVTVRAHATELEYGNQDNCDNAQDLAVAPGGAEVVPACGYPYAHYRYSTATLTQQGSYGSTNYPDAVAIASGTGTVAAGVNNPYATDDIYVYAPDGDKPLSLFNAGSGELVARGLGLTADASELFAVSNVSNSFVLNTYADPTAQQASLTLTGAATASIGHAVTLQGTLTAASPLAGATVTVTRTGPGGTKTLTATTNSGGSFTLTDIPPAAGSYTYTASFAGNATVSPATATLRVTVSLLSASLTVSATPGTANYGGLVRVTAHLGTTDTNRTVEILAQARGASASNRLANAKVNSSGNVTVSGRLARTTTFTAVFLGDAKYAARSAATTVYTRAGVAEAISGYYASKHVGSVTYRLYHHTKHLNVAAAVSVRTRRGSACRCK
jgi:Carboxypeptidase regulatory-like domain